MKGKSPRIAAPLRGEAGNGHDGGGCPFECARDFAAPPRRSFSSSCFPFNTYALRWGIVILSVIHGMSSCHATLAAVEYKPLLI
jgi:hypothetical protein